jgi:hypothetical protein
MWSYKERRYPDDVEFRGPGHPDPATRRLGGEMTLSLEEPPWDSDNLHQCILHCELSQSPSSQILVSRAIFGASLTHLPYHDNPIPWSIHSCQQADQIFITIDDYHNQYANNPFVPLRHVVWRFRTDMIMVPDGSRRRS